jgi:hypothetical protein
MIGLEWSRFVAGYYRKMEILRAGSRPSFRQMTSGSSASPEWTDRVRLRLLLVFPQHRAGALRRHLLGCARVGALSHRVGAAERRHRVDGELRPTAESLIKQFRATVGLAPKTYGRIDRFQSVINACRGKADVCWSRVAASYGFADQSHLIREFRRLGTVTPEEFLGARTPDESHVIVE